MAPSLVGRAASVAIASLGAATILLPLLLAGCSSVEHMALSRCAESGTARFAAIPIASAAEHLQATRFSPQDQSDCLVYVVRDRDVWTGTKVRRATVTLSKQEQGVPRYPADPAELQSLFGPLILGIYDHVYAMWELPAGTYSLQAFIDADYWTIPFSQVQGRVPEKLAVLTELQCKPGALHFLAVGDRGFNHTAYIVPIAADSGKALIRDSLRAAGRYAGAPGYRNCEGTW